MDYNPLNIYLEKFKKILNKNSLEKERIISIVCGEVKHNINTNNFNIKNTIIYFKNISPVLKSEIFLHKEKILKKLKESEVNITDIK